MRKAALHRWLEGKGPSMRAPGAVLELRGKKESACLLEGRLGLRAGCGGLQGVHHLACFVRIALERAQLRPASVGMLFVQQRGCQGLEPARRFSGPRQAQELERARVIVFSLHRPQPLARTIDSLGKLLLAAGQAEVLQSVKRQRRRPHIARLDGRPGQVVAPAPVGGLDHGQVMHPGVGALTGRHPCLLKAEHEISLGERGVGMEAGLPVAFDIIEFSPADHFHKLSFGFGVDLSPASVRIADRRQGQELLMTGYAILVGRMFDESFFGLNRTLLQGRQCPVQG